MKTPRIVTKSYFNSIKKSKISEPVDLYLYANVIDLGLDSFLYDNLPPPFFLNSGTER